MKNSLTRRQLLGAFALAKPGYRFEFPRDHFSHPEFRTEWWYYTGNLFGARRRRFGFELTFFRHALDETAKGGVWEPSPVWLAHLALSDIEGGKFRHYQRMNRGGPGLAGADPAMGFVWNGNWRAGAKELRAVTEDFALRLDLEAKKPPVIHGRNGVSQKANGEGRASHYVSQTRVGASGALRLNGEDFGVEGLAWMDHEFFTHQLEPEQTGWDWMSIQLEDRTELMLFRLRRRDGSVDENSAATYVDATGAARHLTMSEFRLTPSEEWVSDVTKGRYPLVWRIEVPSLGLDLKATTPLQNQELASGSRYMPSYWEGAMDFRGTKKGRSIAGTGYLEMTGYAGAVVL